MKDLIELELLLSQGKISRREFIYKTAAFGAAAAFSPMLLKAQAMASVPKKGGRLRIGHHAFANLDTLDPEIMSSDTVGLMMCQLYNQLVEIGPKGKLIPELAESWEPSSDLKTWVFKLRKGVEFHNGKEFEAEDAVWNINFHSKKDSKSPLMPLLKSVQDVRADDRHAVTITLSEPSIDFPALMAYHALYIAPAGTTDWSKGIGTGPYVLKVWNPGVRALTARNGNYWKQGRAHFDEVEVLSIPDTNARMSALRADQIDVMSSCDLKTVHLLKKDPKIQVIRVPGKLHYNFDMRTDMAPYDNNDVRLALKYAIDREKILKLILNGYGTIGNDNPINSAYQHYNHELPQREYDPDKARFHLKKSGVGDITFELHAAQNMPFTGALDMALLYKQHAAKAGINLKPVKEQDDGYWMNVWKNKPFSACQWSGRISEELMFGIAYAGDAPWSGTFWKNDQFDALFRSAKVERDEKKRRELYWEMQRIISDDCGAIIPVFADYVCAASTKLKFGELSSNRALDGLRLTERWWFES